MPRQRIGDVELHYEVTGQGNPIVFLHGLGSSGRDWEPQVTAFSGRYQVITVDMRGHGQSDKPPGPYSIAGFAADAAGLMDALALGPAHVVGISMGGMIALQLALDAPERVRSLAAVNCGGELVLRTFRERREGWMRFLVARLLGMRRMGEVLSERLFPNEDQAALRTLFVERWAENDQRAYMASMRALVGWSVMERLGEIRCPTLVVASDQDYSPVADKEAVVARIPHAELAVIPDARHAVPFAQPEKFNAVLAAFLAKVHS